MAEEALVFIPMLVPLAIALGYDSLVGVGLALIGPCAGFTGAFLNPFTLGVAQGIVGLPLFSGMEYRLVIYVITVTTASVFIYLYARKIKEEPPGQHYVPGRPEARSSCTGYNLHLQPAA